MIHLAGLTITPSDHTHPLVCNTQAVGDELHCTFDCPHFSNPGLKFSSMLRDAVGFVHVAQETEIR